MPSISQTSTDAAVRTLLSTSPTTQPPYTFTFTPFLYTHGLAATTTVPVCPTYASTGSCPLGRRCPNRHPTPTQQSHNTFRHNDNYVCKHWLKGLCKKGDACDYLHEYNLRKMSECQFYNQNGYCQNGDECLYVHVKEDSKLPVCDDYARGFCEKGPKCGKRHVRRRLCEFYMAGFCPDGLDCRNGVHLRASAKEEQDGKREKDKDKVADLEKREDEQKREFGWRDKKNRGGGVRGRWREKRR